MLMSATVSFISLPFQKSEVIINIIPSVCRRIYSHAVSIQIIDFGSFKRVCVCVSERERERERERDALELFGVALNLSE